MGFLALRGGTKLWDFQHRGGDFRPLTSGHTVTELHKQNPEFARKLQKIDKFYIFHRTKVSGTVYNMLYLFFLRKFFHI